MKAMILAAGFGTRLWPLTIGRTKPAVPFLNRPLIGFTIDYLRRHGINDILINLHHEPESVRAQIGDGSRFGVRITYAVEHPEILGTSGALDNVRELLSDETFFVVNGKIITDIDLKAALKSHRDRHALATLVLRNNHAREHFREVHLTEQGRIDRFGEFPTPQTSHSPLMFTGIHILEPAIFDYIPRGVASDSVKDVYPKAMAEGKAVMGYVAEDSASWYELSTLERYWAISAEFMRREGQTMTMDQDSQIDPSSTVRNSILWKRVDVRAAARVTDCVIGDDVVIPAGAKYHRSVIVRAAITADAPPPEKANAGKVQGENLVVPF
ncbi:MAG: NDP-sugar synthase [Acidobacteria bacterium]|nr:NDP-sugar synthase [Acidobacteriota bacterium]